MQTVHVVIESSKALEEVLEVLESTLEAAELSILLRHDRADAVQVEIGNPLAASEMTRYHPAAGLYFPLRVVVYTADGATKIEYDVPSSLVGQSSDFRITALARQLDAELLGALITAAE